MSNHHQQTHKTAKNLDTLADNAKAVLRAYKDAIHPPSTTKQPVTWPISQAVEMTGRSRSSLINAEKILGAPPFQKQGMYQRVYDMSHILALMDYFGTRPKFQRTRHLAITNYKGGVGKSHLSTHLAHYFAKRGYRTLIVDCDSQATATQTILGIIPDDDIAPEQTLAPLFSGSVTHLEQEVCLQTNWPNLQIIPANLWLLDADMHARTRQMDVLLLYHALDLISDQYDLIIYDTPHTLSHLSMCPLHAADMALIPTTPRIPDFTSTVAFLGELSRMAGNGLEIPITRMAMNMVTQERRVTLNPNEALTSEQKLIQYCRQYYGEWLLDGEMPTSTLIQRLADEHHTLFESSIYNATWQRAAKGVIQIANQVEELLTIYDDMEEAIDEQDN